MASSQSQHTVLDVHCPPNGQDSHKCSRAEEGGCLLRVLARTFISQADTHTVDPPCTRTGLGQPALQLHWLQHASEGARGARGAHHKAMHRASTPSPAHTSSASRCSSISSSRIHRHAGMVCGQGLKSAAAPCPLSPCSRLPHRQRSSPLSLPPQQHQQHQPMDRSHRRSVACGAGAGAFPQPEGEGAAFSAPAGASPQPATDSQAKPASRKDSLPHRWKVVVMMAVSRAGIWSCVLVCACA